MYSPGNTVPIPPMVSAWTNGWGIVSEGSFANAPASTAWENANRGTWVPLMVPAVCVARRLWWANGVTVSASYNIEVGLYLDGGHKPGTKLITSGSVAQGTASQVQFCDITDTTLTPGLYWIYVSCSSTSATLFRSLSAATQEDLLRFEQESVGPGSAPSTATPVEASYNAVWLCGFATTASP